MAIKLKLRNKDSRPIKLRKRDESQTHTQQSKEEILALINPADLAMMEEILRPLTAHESMVVSAYASGMKTGQIAKIVGIDQQNVARILNKPHVKNAVKMVVEKNFGIVRPKIIDILLDMLDKLGVMSAGMDDRSGSYRDLLDGIKYMAQLLRIDPDSKSPLDEDMRGDFTVTETETKQRKMSIAEGLAKLPEERRREAIKVLTDIYLAKQEEKKKAPEEIIDVNIED